MEWAETLIPLIDKVVATKDLDEWAELFERHEITWGHVPDPPAVAADPQMHAAGVFPELNHPEHGPIHTVASPLELDDSKKVEPAAAPKLGEHSREILGELGYDAEVIDAMLQSGATIEN